MYRINNLAKAVRGKEQATVLKRSEALRRVIVSMVQFGLEEKKFIEVLRPRWAGRMQPVATNWLEGNAVWVM